MNICYFIQYHFQELFLYRYHKETSNFRYNLPMHSQCRGFFKNYIMPLNLMGRNLQGKKTTKVRTQFIKVHISVLPWSPQLYKASLFTVSPSWNFNRGILTTLHQSQNLFCVPPGNQIRTGAVWAPGINYTRGLIHNAHDSFCPLSDNIPLSTHFY